MIRISFLHAENKECQPIGWRLRNNPDIEFFGGISKRDSVGTHYDARLARGKSEKFEFSRSDWNRLETSLCVDFCKIVPEKALPVLRIANCKDDDEIILLLTICGEENEIIQSITGIKADIVRVWKGYIHTCPVAHVVARLKSEDGYVAAEIQRNGKSVDVAVFSWKCKHFVVALKEYNELIESNSLFLDRETIEQELEDYDQLRKARKNSAEYRKNLLTDGQLEDLSDTLNAYDSEYSYDFSNDTYIFRIEYKTNQKVAFLYSDKNLAAFKRRAKRLRVGKVAKSSIA